MKTSWTLAGLAGALAVAAPLAAMAQAQIVGVPTYHTAMHQDIDTGDAAPVNLVIVGNGYKSAGSSGSVVGVLGWSTPGMPPSATFADANDTTLKAQAVASAKLEFMPAQLPHAHATALAENTRFWQFNAPQSLSFTSIMDGSLSALLTPFEVVGSQTFATVRYGLDLLDAQGQLMLNVFTLQAQVQAIGFDRSLHFTQSASGYADPALWAAAFTRTDDGGDYYHRTMAYDIVHTDVITLPAAWDVAAGALLGIHWWLEADSGIEGLLGGATMSADLGHTVHFGFTGGDEAVIARGAVEVLTAAPVPEPGALGMLLAGLAVLVARCRPAQAGRASPRCLQPADDRPRPRA